MAVTMQALFMICNDSTYFKPTTRPRSASWRIHLPPHKFSSFSIFSFQRNPLYVRMYLFDYAIAVASLRRTRNTKPETRNNESVDSGHRFTNCHQLFIFKKFRITSLNYKAFGEFSNDKLSIIRVPIRIL